jgi:prevent-host-death family protein
MTRTMTATEARVHFGELLDTVKAGGRVVVEKSGRPVAVFISSQEYETLTCSQIKTDWLEAAARSRERMAEILNSRPLPDVREMIDFGRDVD